MTPYVLFHAIDAVWRQFGACIVVGAVVVLATLTLGARPWEKA